MKSFIKKHSNKLTIITACLLLVSCGDSVETKENSMDFHHPLKPYNWLLGKWLMDERIKGLHEDWKYQENGTFIGKSYYINNTTADTVLLETMTLKVVKDEIHLCPRVVDQNAGREIDFVLTTDTPDSLVFVNQQHESPNIIGYKRKDDEIFAWTEGSDGYETTRVDFHFLPLKSTEK